MIIKENSPRWKSSCSQSSIIRSTRYFYIIRDKNLIFSYLIRRMPFDFGTGETIILPGLYVKLFKCSDGGLYIIIHVIVSS